MALKRASCKTWLPSGSMLRHFHGLVCLVLWIVILEMKRGCFSSQVCPGCLLEQPMAHCKREVRQSDRQVKAPLTMSTCQFDMLTVYVPIGFLTSVFLLLHFTDLKRSLSFTGYAYMKQPMFYSQWSFNIMTNYNWQQVSVYRLKITWFTFSVLY